jgi:serine protease inhibitor
MPIRIAVRLLLGAALAGSLAAVGCANSPVATAPAGLTVPARAVLAPSSDSTFTPVILIAPPATDAEKTAAALAVNQFGLDLLRATEKRTLAESPNTVMSPLSAHVALAMTSDGASGQTRAEMRQAMGVSDAADAGYRATIASIWNTDQGQLQIADSVWTQKGFPIRRTYADLMRSHFGADTTSTDFTTMTGPDAVNAWVAKRTNGLITKSMDGPDPALRVLLLNTAHFLAAWQTPFDSRETRPAAFHLASGKSVQTPTMHVEDAFAQADLGNADVLELPYQGGHTSMLVFLPKPGVTVDSLLATMTAQSVRTAETSLAATEAADVEVSLPKTKRTWSADLIAPLKSMGIQRAFVPGAADFSAMTTSGPLWIDSAEQMTYLDVNEVFTEAAVATGFGMHGGYAPPPPQFDVDRPYLMALVDKPTGALLFLAAIRDPSKK